VKIKSTDYNGAAAIVSPLWGVIENAIAEMPLRLKASDQAGLQGNMIFDPVGTNSALKEALVAAGWHPKVTIPSAYQCLGTDVDFEKDGVILEVQFSNYPFLLNNVIRTYLFSCQRVAFNGRVPKALIVITKCKVFPASNSTLYFEQGKNQLDILAASNVAPFPIRLVGLSEDAGSKVPCICKMYHNPRYSRTVVDEKPMTCAIQSAGARARFVLE
jgi:hypothetical protein